MKEIFVTGASGLVGSRFVEMLPQGWQPLTPSVKEVDITNMAEVRRFLEANRVDYIVHFAAVTNVNEAEKERGDKDGVTWRVNVTGTENIAKLASESNIGLLHVSTDFVFPGSKDDPGPYSEEHPLPKSDQDMSWYAWSKRTAEDIVNSTHPKAAVVRIMMPFRANFQPKDDLVRHILKLYDADKLYPMFTDQFITPTYIDEAMSAFIKIISEDKSGVFHTVCKGITTPYELSSYLLEKARGVQGVVRQASIHEFLKIPGTAPRVILGGLNSDITEENLGIKFSSWQNSIDKVIEQIASVQ